MLFSSPTFLAFFLPLTIILYFMMPWRNASLLALSFLFYAWGEPYFVALLAGVIVFNYYFGLRVADAATAAGRRRWLATGVITNVLVLVAFKYLDFLIGVLNVALLRLGLPAIPLPGIPLPLGVSFFTFQAISYLVDIRRGHVQVERNLFYLALFKSVFPQLIAGPIVRYGEMSADLHGRKARLDEVVEGLELFVVGLGKKVLIADTLAVPTDVVMRMPVAELTGPGAWVGIICFSLQIYFDFSGYTDMARGLGRVFGFHFPENFRHPYAAGTVQDFWRRWHMTLSRWFRDYVYIPLGGSRCAPWRTSANLWVVFGLCGLWHGANWTFLIWGLWHGAFLVLERTRFGGWVEKAPAFVRHAYVLLVVAVGWVFFRSPSLDHALSYLGRMFAGSGWSTAPHAVLQCLNYFQLAMLVAGGIAALPLAPRVKAWLDQSAQPMLLMGLRQLALLALVVASFGAIAATTLQSFIYFRF